MVEVPTAQLRSDFRVCRQIIAHGSKSFYAASLLMPAALRDPAFALYAFCRVSDDAVDTANDPGAAIPRLRGRLDGVYRGAPRDHPVDRALADTVRRYAIPRSVFDALIEGFVWDVEGRSYRTLPEVYAYAARVAGSVGAMMAALMGVRSAALLARACDLGVAMQLTNIARDVGEDARAGRLYLPREWLENAGLDVAAWMRDPKPVPAVRAATLRLLNVADELYRHGDAGIAGLPPECRAAIQAARLIYAEIGVRVRAAGGDSVSQRAITPTSRKLALAAQAVLAPSHSGLAVGDPPLPETRFLVDAVAACPGPQSMRRLGLLAQADESWGRVFDLFQDLENRRRFGSVQ